MFCGHDMAGASLSMVTVKEQLRELDEASVAMQMTVVTPRGKAVPEGGWHWTVVPGQLSATAGAGKETIAEL